MITCVPPIASAYSPDINRAPLFRGILDRLIYRLSSAASGLPQETSNVGEGEPGPFSAQKVVSMYPPLSPTHLQVLLAETVHAIASIGGHENPPARHIVGWEAVASVKEKLRTVSKELEDFVQTSSAIDIP